jgi:hypothetical protein
VLAADDYDIEIVDNQMMFHAVLSALPFDTISAIDDKLKIFIICINRD